MAARFRRSSRVQHENALFSERLKTVSKFLASLSIPSRRAKGTILVVDDDPLVLEVTQRFFEQRKMRALTAQNAIQALEILDEGRVDVVLLDIHMPHQDGFALLPKLRVLYPSVPVVMLTGDGYPAETMNRCAKLGASGFVSKHTEMENVVLAVVRALKGISEAVESAKDASPPAQPLGAVC